MNFVTSIHPRPNSDVIVLTVPESALGKVASSTLTSRRQLSFLKRAIARDLGLIVEFIISRGKVSEDMEAGLNGLLQSRFPGAILDCFTSFLDANTVEVSLARTAAGNEPSTGKVEHAIKDYLRVFGTTLGAIHWVATDEELPSPVVILREIKVSSPVLPNDLAPRLGAKGFRVPPGLWLQRKLDTLRRRQLAIRRKDGCYVLTEKGLSAVPHRAGPKSSDVERALALAKMRW